MTNISSGKQLKAGVKLRAHEKVKKIPVKILPTETLPKKPKWIRVKTFTSNSINRIKGILRDKNLHSVCEEASCPNLGECFHNGTATFMIMGDICTRRCPFCDVAHGRPKPLDTEEPIKLAQAIAQMNLNYVVITSVDRDDLRDGGASHFISCINQIRKLSPMTKIEILVPDFRSRIEAALSCFSDDNTPDVFNHNLETIPRLYLEARPGANYKESILLLKQFKDKFPNIPTKSGLMVGLGETNEEILDVLQDLREHNVDMITIGQYLQPSKHHLLVKRFVTPEEFDMFKKKAQEMGFSHIASAPLVRSSYHADEQAKNILRY